MDVIFLNRQQVTMPDGARMFQMGETFAFPEAVARKLIQLCPGKVRLVEVANPKPKDLPIVHVCGTCKKGVPLDETEGRGFKIWDVLHCRSCQDSPFNIDERVQYQIPVFPAYDAKARTPEPAWKTRRGTVTGYDDAFQLVAITDGQGGVVQVAKCYVKKEVLK